MDSALSTPPNQRKLRRALLPRKPAEPVCPPLARKRPLPRGERGAGKTVVDVAPPPDDGPVPRPIYDALALAHADALRREQDGASRLHAGAALHAQQAAAIKRLTDEAATARENETAYFRRGETLADELADERAEHARTVRAATELLTKRLYMVREMKGIKCVFDGCPSIADPQAPMMQAARCGCSALRYGCAHCVGRMTAKHGANVGTACPMCRVCVMSWTFVQDAELLPSRWALPDD